MDCCCSFSGTNAKMPDTYAVKFLVNDSFANLLVPNRGEARGKRGSYAVLMDNDFSHILGMTIFFRFVFSSGIICSIALFCRYYG